MSTQLASNKLTLFYNNSKKYSNIPIVKFMNSRKISLSLNRAKNLKLRKKFRNNEINVSIMNIH